MKNLKKEILRRLRLIETVAHKTDMQGQVILRFSFVPLDTWEAVVDNITEYPKCEHFITVAPNLTVVLILD